MEMPFLVFISIAGLLMKTHRVRASRFEQVVITRADLPEYIGKAEALVNPKIA